MADTDDAWRRLDERIRCNTYAFDLESMLAPHSVDFINRRMPEADKGSHEIAHTLLYTAIDANFSDVVALLLLHGANPLQTVREYYDFSVNGERRIVTCNAMEACEYTLRCSPMYGIFLLRLLDSRPVATAYMETHLLNSLGRDVDAPLANPAFPRTAQRKGNALYYACNVPDVYSVRWLLYGRKANPFAVAGGFDALMRLIDENRYLPKQNDVTQIRALLNEWMAAWTNRHLAVGMAAHRRLGSASPLGTLPPDTMRIIARGLNSN
jgi:hypothetical protein